jgi:hypothetical protein
MKIFMLSTVILLFLNILLLSGCGDGGHAVITPPTPYCNNTANPAASCYQVYLVNDQTGTCSAAAAGERPKMWYVENSSTSSDISLVLQMSLATGLGSPVGDPASPLPVLLKAGAPPTPLECQIALVGGSLLNTSYTGLCEAWGDAPCVPGAPVINSPQVAANRARCLTPDPGDAIKKGVRATERLLKNDADFPLPIKALETLFPAPPAGFVACERDNITLYNNILVSSGLACKIEFSLATAGKNIQVRVDVPSEVTAARTLNSEGLDIVFRSGYPSITIPSATPAEQAQFEGELREIVTSPAAVTFAVDNIYTGNSTCVQFSKR